MSAASALSHHYATHAQLIQSDAHAPFKVLQNVIDGDRSAAQARSKEHRQTLLGPMLSPSTGLRSARHFLSDLLAVSQRLDDPALIHPAMRTACHHALKLGLQGCQAGDALFHLDQPGAGDLIGHRA